MLTANVLKFEITLCELWAIFVLHGNSFEAIIATVLSETLKLTNIWEGMTSQK